MAAHRTLQPRLDGDAPRAALTALQQALAARHLGLAGSVARQFSRRFGSREEFFGACLLALCKAARGYDAARGVSFALYARIRLTGACIDQVRAEIPAGLRRRGQPREEDDAPRAVRVESLDPVSNRAHSAALGHHDPTEGLDRQLDATERIGRALAALTPKQAEVIEAIDLRGESVDEVARRLGLSQVGVRDRRWKALARMRQALETDEGSGER